MNIDKIVKNVLTEAAKLRNSMVLTEEVDVTENLKYHINNQIPLFENVFRSHSDAFFDLINEVRDLWNKGKIDLNNKDILMIESDLGKKVKIGKEYVYLDAPYIYETEEGVLTESKIPKGPKKFAVYTKDKTGGVKKVTFGNSNLILKESRNCSQKTDRTTATYWSCNLGRYAKQLGLSSSNSQ